VGGKAMFLNMPSGGPQILVYDIPAYYPHYLLDSGLFYELGPIQIQNKGSKHISRLRYAGKGSSAGSKPLRGREKPPSKPLRGSKKIEFGYA